MKNKTTLKSNKQSNKKKKNKNKTANQHVPITSHMQLMYKDQLRCQQIHH